ncbi:MAG: translation elongation factor [Chloroflexi bacterium]|jgi:elongation factor P|nr:translation elongation factor [Chloroflexota bacterium]
MISTGDLKRGISVELDGELYRVMEFNHIKMGRGSAQVRLRLRNLRTGSITEKTVQAGERFQRARLDSSTVQFLYADDDTYHFMNTETYDQLAIPESLIGDDTKFLKENMEVELLSYGDEPIAVDLPPNVELRITYTEPGIRGDTASGTTKPATVETGAVVLVPLFINQDEVIRVDTRTGQYIERVSK